MVLQYGICIRMISSVNSKVCYFPNMIIYLFACVCVIVLKNSSVSYVLYPTPLSKS